ncbi:hypothetical protein PRZ48_005680 [Zasmidium cellare]|uniref:Uncharacterized protein n=1 Tax=Zasmidium cellare TaxID=395010 RepID=A0ABR0ELX8_ZASCE|nr:hypothetical protein PRZ48_005680 [Zasmidium cellare]
MTRLTTTHFFFQYLIFSSSAVFTQFWNVTPPINSNDTLYAGWPQIKVSAEIEIYNGVAHNHNRTYAHHPQLYARGNRHVYLIHSSAAVDEDSMGQNIWFSQSHDGGFTWTPSVPILPPALLKNQTQEGNFSYFCNEGIQQRALQADALIEHEGLLYAIAQTTDFWCAGDAGSGNHAAGRIVRPLHFNGSLAGDPCWIVKNNWTDYVRYNKTVYGTKYGMRHCEKARELSDLLAKPEYVPPWSDFEYNQAVYAADNNHSMQEVTHAVWLEHPGVWQRFWRDVSPMNNSMAVWVEYSRTGRDWYSHIEREYGNQIFETNIPDAKTKQFLLDLRDLKLLFSNPRANTELVRQPLTIVSSRGWTYEKVGVLRTNASTRIAPDTRDYKNRGFSYPAAVGVGKWWWRIVRIRRMFGLVL